MEQEAAEAKDLLKGMADAKGGVVSVAGGQVVDMLTTGEELSAAAAEYEAQRAKAQEQLANPGSVGVGSTFKRQKAALKQKLKKEETKIELGAAENDIVRGRLQEATEQMRKQKEYNVKLGSEIEALTRLEEADSTRKADLDALKRLVMLNESLRGQEQAFKGSCKSQRTKLTAELAELQEAGTDPQDARLTEIEAMHAKVQSKYQRLRQMLAQKNQAVAEARRLIDDIPTRTELIQYERRFVELYAQVTRKLEEVRKYYDMYNILEQKRDYLDKEVKLLNSISDNFDTAMRGRQANKDQFLEEFEKIIAGVSQQQKNQEQAFLLRASKVETLNNDYQDLVEQERSYFTAVKDFQDECNRNELLEGRLKELEKQ